MSAVLMRDVSRAGHELGRARLHDLPDRLPLRDLLRARVEADVAAYDQDPGPVFRGLVQPPDAMRHSDGFRMSRPRTLEAAPMIAAAHEAVRRGLLAVRVGETTVDDLDAEVPVAEHDEIVTVLERSVVARDA